MDQMFPLTIQTGPRMTKYQEAFGMNQMPYGCSAKFKWLCKYQGPFGMGQMSYGPNVLWMFCTELNIKDILDRTKCLLTIFHI